MKATYRFYIHSMTDVYVTDNYDIAVDIALDMADRDNSFILFYDSEKGRCIHHIDDLIKQAVRKDFHEFEGKVLNHDLNENR